MFKFDYLGSGISSSLQLPLVSSKDQLFKKSNPPLFIQCKRVYRTHTVQRAAESETGQKSELKSQHCNPFRLN
jgi:hypothetical protein